MSQMCRITVFTATYNRDYIIDNLYKSLVNQTFRDFEWLIIDHGSDGTEKKVKQYIADNKISSIRYYKSNERKGLNRAMNDAVTVANGELFFKVDDDDYLTDDALESIDKWEKTISNCEKYAGVSGLRAYPDGRIIGDTWKKNVEYIDATGLERRKYGLQGDKAEAYYTVLLKKYGPLPEIEGETLTFESMLYDKIAFAGYKIRWFGKAIYFTEYLEDGVTKNTKNRLKNNINTYGLLLASNLRYNSQPYSYMFKNLCRYGEMCRKKEMNFYEACDKFDCKRTFVKLCWFLSAFTKYI